MSLFFQTDEQLQDSLATLPESYSDEEITAMVIDLLADMASSPRDPFENLGAKVMHYSEKHKKFCLSFPMLFRSTIKGSFTPSMLKMFLATRRRMEKGEVGTEQAKNILVDAGVAHIKARGTRSATR